MIIIKMCKWTTILLNALRYVWDTQNRLLAASSNGYVSTYIYDGDGQRVLKQHGGNEAVYTNGTQAALRSEPSQYTLYANPYFVMHDGERYTEHIYIGQFDYFALRYADSVLASMPDFTPALVIKYNVHQTFGFASNDRHINPKSDFYRLNTKAFQDTIHHLDSLGYTNVPQEVYMQTINEGRRVAEENKQ